MQPSYLTTGHLGFGRSEGSWEGVAGPAGPQGLSGRGSPQSVSLPPPEQPSHVEWNNIGVTPFSAVVANT